MADDLALFIMPYDAIFHIKAIVTKKGIVCYALLLKLQSLREGMKVVTEDVAIARIWYTTYITHLSQGNDYLPGRTNCWQVR